MKKKILIVEDGKSLREIMKEWIELNFNNSEVITAEDGKEAIQILEKYSLGFALVITDFKMPGLNGTEVIKWIKQRDTASSIKTILMSAEDLRISWPAGKLAQMDKFLLKPFDFEALKMAINNLLKK